MNGLEIRRLEMFRRVIEFWHAHIEHFPPTTLGRALFVSLDAIRVEIEEAAAAQSAAGGSARLGTAGKGTARTRLRGVLEMIVRTARAMAFSIPGFDDKFRMPHNVSDQVLLNTARAFAAEAPPFKDEFIRHELPADFLETLNASIADFERGVQGQNTGNAARQSAKATIDAAVKRGMEAVRRLNPIILNKFKDDPAALASWESARHVERSPRPKPEENNNQPAPPPQ
ncbi:MAG TPA: hypothetical protein VGX48_14990 [Pyrinomonadaceae bacterium]|jgi:hypothetical protein|nr:hypothetical protein [Pyrinomonadaceae bacterium]